MTVNLSLNAASGGDGNDTLSGFENICGSIYGDTLIGDAGANVLNGNLGSDHMEGGAGSDTYYADDAGDEIVESSAQAMSTCWRAAFRPNRRPRSSMPASGSRATRP